MNCATREISCVRACVRAWCVHACVRACKQARQNNFPHWRGLAPFGPPSLGYMYLTFRSCGRSIDQALDRSHGPSIDRSIARTIGGLVDRSITRSLGRSVAGSVDKLLSRSLDRSFARSVDRSDGVLPQNLQPRYPAHSAFFARPT